MQNNSEFSSLWGMLAFSCGGGRGVGGKPFRIRNYGRVFFQKPRTKFSVFKNIRIRVDGAWSDDRIVISIKKYIPKMWCKTIQSFFFLLIKPFPFLSFSSPSSSSWLLELAVAFTTETCTILDMRRRISLKKRLFDGKCASKTTSASTHRETPNW